MFQTLTARRSASFHCDKFVRFTDVFVSLPKQSYRVVIFGREVTSDWVALGSPSLHFQDLSLALPYINDSQIL